MTSNQHPDNQPPQMPLPPQQGRPMGQGKRRARNWRERLFGGTNARPLTLREERTLPNWLVGMPVAFFFVSMLACWAAWGHPMEMQYAIIASVSVLLFFFGTKYTSQSWVGTSEKTFVRNVFILGLCARLLWVFYCYFYFYPDHYGNTFGESADVEWYMPFGEDIANWIRDGMPYSFQKVIDRNLAAIDDIGYPVWLAIVNLITFGESDVFAPFLIKCIIGAYCAVCIYHIAKRHFGDGAARIAALFVALNPNMIYWCGTMMKEAEMVFLCCLCIDLVDKAFTSGAKLTFKSLMPGLFAGVYLFFYRAPLSIVIFLAMLAHIAMASNRVMSIGKKVIAGVMVGIVLFVGIGDRLRTQTERIRYSVENNDVQQQQNFEWRSRRAGGNSFAKYASRAVFAPLIFTIPFPTFNEALKEQIVQQQTSGGSYIRNILSFFVIFVMFILLINGEWRKHVFILAYTMGYLVTLVLSNFAQSGRFHMPIWPMLMLFSAYGLQIAKTNPKMRKWWPMVLVVEVILCLGWNWFKLKGRGMI